MYYKQIPHSINHYHLKNDLEIQLIRALHILNMNWSYYKKDLKTSIRNSLLLYTIIQINDKLRLYQLQFVNAVKHQLILTRNQIFNLYTYTLFNLISVNAHVEFLFHETLLTKILTIRKFQKNFFLTFHVLVSNIFFCFTNSTPVPTHHEGGSPIPPNVDPTAYDLIMLEVDDILPSPLTPRVPAPTVPEPVCEMQTPALFTMAQSSPQPHSVVTASYARVNPLPSPATSSLSSGELHLYIHSDTSSPSVPAGPQSSSHELLLQGTSHSHPTLLYCTQLTLTLHTKQPPVPQPPPLFSIAHTAVSAAQPPPQPTSIPSWADEVATAEQSGHSTPETVAPNWAYSGRIRGALVYPPLVMPTPHTERPPVPSPRYGPAMPPLRPQQLFPQPPPYDRPTSLDNYTCTDPSPRSTTTSHSTWNIPRSFFTITGFTDACPSHSEPFTRPTALII